MTQAVDLDELKAQLERRLQTPAPATSSEKVDVLENHLRQTLEACGDLSAPLSLDPAGLDRTVRFIREAITQAHERTQFRESFSPCDTAAVTGACLITAGAALHPAAAVIGFMIGVELLLESC